MRLRVRYGDECVYVSANACNSCWHAIKSETDSPHEHRQHTIEIHLIMDFAHHKYYIDTHLFEEIMLKSDLH